MSTESKAIVILIDNSDTSLNQDFYPNRLDAQKIAAKQVSGFQFNTNQKTQIALFTCGSKEIGIRISFTSVPQKISSALDNIKIGGDLKLFSIIQQAIVSFHFSDPVQQRRILCFVGAPNDLTEREGKILVEKCKKEKVDLNFVVFGGNVPNKDLLNSIAKGTSSSASYIELKENSVICDAVLNSDFGPGEENSRVGLDTISSIDPALASELKRSITLQQTSPMKEKDSEKKGKSKKKKSTQ